MTILVYHVASDRILLDRKMSSPFGLPPVFASKVLEHGSWSFAGSGASHEVGIAARAILPSDPALELAGAVALPSTLGEVRGLARYRGAGKAAHSVWYFAAAGNNGYYCPAKWFDPVIVSLGGGASWFDAYSRLVSVDEAFALVLAHHGDCGVPEPPCYFTDGPSFAAASNPECSA